MDPNLAVSMNWGSFKVYLAFSWQRSPRPFGQKHLLPVTRTFILGVFMRVESSTSNVAGKPNEVARKIT